MARSKRLLPDGQDWVGKRVAYRSRPDAYREFGTVVRMATGKTLAMFVQYDSDTQPKLTYAKDLEVL